MNDHEILHTIEHLVNEEHQLMNKAAAGGLEEEEHAKMKELEVRLDQCWDLLRQRRARKEFGLNPDDAKERDASTVEHYQQ